MQQDMQAQNDSVLFPEDDLVDMEQEINLFENVNTDAPSEPYQNVLAADAAIIRSVTRETADPLSEFSTAKDELNRAESTDKWKADIAQEYSDYYAGLYTEVLEEELSSNLSMDELIDTARFVEEDISRVQQITESMGLPYAATHAKFGDEIGTFLVMYARQKEAEKNEQYGLWDWTKGIAKSMIIPGLGTWNLSDMTGENMLKAPDQYNKMLTAFQQMPPEEQALYIPVLSDWIRESFGDNPLEVGSRLQEMFSYSAAADVDLAKWLERFDVGLTIALPLIYKAAVAGSKLTKASEMLKVLNERETMAKTLVGAIADTTEGVASAANTSRVEAMADALPFDLTKYFPHTSRGMSADVQELLDAQRIAEATGTQIQRDLDEILDPNYAELERMGLNPTELRTALESEIATFREKQARLSNPVVGDVVHKDLDGGFRLEADILVDGKTTTIKKDTYFKWNDEGALEFSDTPEGLRGTGALSGTLGSAMGKLDNFWEGSRKFGKNLAQIGQRIDYQRARLADDLNRVAERSVEFLSAPEKKQLGEVIQAIDVLPTDEKKWEAMQAYHLMKGTHTGIKLNAKQVAAYVNTRRIQDALHVMRNRKEYQILNREGFKEMSLLGRRSVLMRPLARGKYPKDFGVGKEVYDAESRTFRTMSKEEVSAMYDKGYTLVRFKNREKIGEDKYARLAVVKSDEMNDLDPLGEYVAYRPGYSTRIYKGNFYAVSEFGEITLDGSKAVDKIRTERVFQSYKDALAFARVESEKWAKSKGATFDPNNEKSWRYQIPQENMFTARKGDADGYSTFGDKLYTGARAEHDILFGLDGATPVRVSAFEELQRNIDNLAKLMPINEFRYDFTERWLNQARKIDRTIDWKTPDIEIHNAFGIANDGKQKARTLIEARKWLDDQLHIPTTSEMKWNDFVVSAVQKAERWDWFNNSNIHRWSMNIGATDPYAAVRAATFHTLLGVLNPAQIVIQGMNAVQGIALDGGKNLPKALAMQNAYQLYKRRNYTALALVDKTLGFKEGDLLQTLRELDRTGLMQSVRQNADLASMERGAGFDAGTMARVLDKGLLFYRGGEHFSRTYSFLVAKQRYLKKFNKPDGYKLTNKDLQTVASDATNMMLNLNRANRANWQKGFLSIPTQFWQVTAKYTETMAKGIWGKGNSQFTQAEALRIGGMHLGLFGAVGAPFLDKFMGYAAEMAGYDPSNPPPEWAQKMEQGLLETAIEWSTGVRIDLATRGAPAHGFEEMIKRLLEDGTPLPMVAMGAASTPARKLYNAIVNETAKPMLEIGPMDIPKEAYFRMLTSYADVVSTFSNAYKGYLWDKNQGIFNNNFIKIDELRSQATPWLKAMGFQPKIVREVYDAKAWLKAQGEEDRNTSKKISVAWRDYMKDGDDKKYQAMRQFASGENTSDPNFVRIERNAQKAVHKDKTALEDITKRILKQSSEYGRDYTGLYGD